MRRPPIRLRLALAFAGVMAVVLAATGLFLYLHLRSDIDRTINRGLRSRAADVTALVQQADTGLRDAGATRARGAGDVAQILRSDGRIFDASPGLGRSRLLTASQLGAAQRGAVSVDRAAAPVGTMRLLAVPIHAQEHDLVVVVGASLVDRDQALASLGALLLVGGAGALLLASLAGYGLASGALRPVESMRRRAASISSERLHERLPLGRTHDELHRLGQTLNDMLARLEEGMERQRAFTAEASHELRTPLTMLKTELELMARDRPTGAQLAGSIDAAVDEADRLARLIDDLLVVARSDADGLAVRMEDVLVAQLLTTVASRYDHAGAGPRIAVAAPDHLVMRADPGRLQQALGNLVDNAVRHGRGPITLCAEPRGAVVELHVRDSGPGFPPGFAARAFDRFARADDARGESGTGLGLAIVRAIARGHGGDAHIARGADGGADVWLALPAARGPSERARLGTVQGRPAMIAP
ncbi:MAG: HAMP domain-containing sensor histidine kinase [Solirubrobacteraceae bacterium]